jgi:hypothetical protein
MPLRINGSSWQRSASHLGELHSAEGSDSGVEDQLSWFLLAEEDRMILPDTQRFIAERMGANIRPHKVDHTPMHTAPELVVDIILEAAQSTPAR